MSGASDSTAPGSGPKLPRMCRVCMLGESDGKKLRLCQRCHSASYCGRECQMANWPKHKAECKKYHQLQQLAQEAHGDAGALNASRLTQWITRVEHPFLSLVATLLYKISDTHILLLTTKRYEKRPYFKVEEYKVVPGDKFAVEYPGEYEEMVRGPMHEFLMSHRHENGTYGLIVIMCSNDPMIPTLCLPQHCLDPIPHIPSDLMAPGAARLSCS
eukprot:gene11003-18967_t